MKNFPIFCFALVIIIFSFFLPNAQANNGQNVQVWSIEAASEISLSFFSSSRCLNASNSSLDINVTAVKDNQLDPDATVTATVFKPNGDTNNVNFADNNDGNYSLTYFFDATGTYRFQVHAMHNSSTGDLNAFVHVGSVGMSVVFLNNGQTYTSGTTQSITTRVTNSDGNVFEGISGTVSITYPSGSSFVSGQSMTASSTLGQYTYTFTVPSQTGTYPVSSTFSCGLNSDTNSNGSFIVPSTGGGGTDTGTGTTPTVDAGGGGGGGGGRPVCGNFVCEKGESAKTCFSDCGVIAGPDGTILAWKFEEEAQLGRPNRLIVDIQNTGNKKQDYVLSIVISQGRNLEYSFEETISGVEIGQEISHLFESQRLVLLGGSHELVISLYSLDKRAKYDELIESFDLGGEFKYDVIVECKDDFVKRDSYINAMITFLNTGAFFEDVDIKYWVEDIEGRIFGMNSMPVALYPNEPKELNQKVFLGQSANPGQYFFKAKVQYKDFSKEAFCTFLLEVEPNYTIKIAQQPEFFPIWIILILLLILLALLLLLLLLRKKEKKEKRNGKENKNKISRIEFFLGLAEQNNSKAFKHKSVIDKLLGLR